MLYGQERKFRCAECGEIIKATGEGVTTERLREVVQEGHAHNKHGGTVPYPIVKATRSGKPATEDFGNLVSLGLSG